MKKKKRKKKNKTNENNENNGKIVKGKKIIISKDEYDASIGWLLEEKKTQDKAPQNSFSYFIFTHLFKST